MWYFLFKTFLPIYFWLPILIIYNYILTNYKSVCRIEFIKQATTSLSFLYFCQYAWQVVMIAKNSKTKQEDKSSYSQANGKDRGERPNQEYAPYYKGH